MDVCQVHKLGADILEGLAELLDLALDARDPVDALDSCPAAVHDGHAALHEWWNLGPHLQEVVAEVHPEGGHLPEEPLGAAEQVEGLQTLLVAGQTAVRTLVALPVDVRVALAAFAGLLDLAELVGICSF